MKNPVRAVKITLDQLINSEPPNGAQYEFITPTKATIMSLNYGTLVETAEGSLFLVPVGDWFRSQYSGKGMEQVSAFNELQDFGLTAIKDKVVRQPEKESLGQEIRVEDNVSVEKADEAVAANPERKKKDQNRSGTP